MKRGAIIGISAVASLVILAALPSSKYFCVTALSPAELGLKRLKLSPPSEEDCSEIRQALARSTQVAGPGHKKAVRNTTPLSTHEIAIYRAVVEGGVSGDRSSWNVSDKTFPL